jgi:hypothetical protein
MWFQLAKTRLTKLSSALSPRQVRENGAVTAVRLLCERQDALYVKFFDRFGVMLNLRERELFAELVRTSNCLSQRAGWVDA